uniref:DUF4278 domain-containing protein n=1 Tax=Cyanothece sp. (strain PCC 7425 / ATCC 29141) TaxID=395961 RepID=B8HK84_CYAP4
MQLCYRGTTYEIRKPSVDMPEVEYSARYRGVAYRINCPIYSPFTQFFIGLRYRGVCY